MSPMCTRPSWEPDQSSAVSVVPLPAWAGPAAVMSCTAVSACGHRVGQRVEQVTGREAGLQRLQRVDGGRAGQFPAAAQPSATASSRALAYAASWLAGRRRPMSDAAA